MITKKRLAILLSKLEKLKEYKIKLEQYPINEEIAAEILWIAYLNKDIQNKTIADLGCGNGILGIASLLLGAKKVYFVDSDKDAIKITKNNLKKLNLKNVIIVNKDIKDFNKKINLVIENPPFGVKIKHIDKKFLEKAMKISNKIYSFHKIESKDFIEKLSKENNFKVEKIITLDFLINRIYKFHKKKKYKFKVGCWILKKRKL